MNLCENPTLKCMKDLRTIEIATQPFTIGRALTCNHVLYCTDISRIHCQIERDDNGWFLKDTSLNGTLINNKLHNQCRVVLKDGDEITLNSTHYVYIFNNPSPAQTQELDDNITDEDLCCFADAVEVAENVDVATNPPVEEPNKKRKLDEVENEKKPSVASQSLDMELTCSICSEMFIKAVTLTCSHTFCKYCVELWRKTNNICPICRTPIVGMSPTLVLDNLIDKHMESCSEEAKEIRRQIIAERRLDPKPQNNNDSRLGNSNPEGTVEVSSDSEAEEDEDDDTYPYNSNSDDDYDDYTGRPGVYYGGYGRCYACGRSGHWANGCPYRDLL